MNLIRVLRVAVNNALPDSLAGAWLDLPRAGDTCEAAATRFQGWCAGRQGHVAFLEVRAQGVVRSRIAVNLPRPDVNAHLSGVGAAATSGFSANVDLSGPVLSDVSVAAVLATGERVGIARLEVAPAWQSPSSPEEQGLVSVVIPCYNQAHFVGEAIDSALAQLDARVEVVVVDDGSTDNTLAVAARYPSISYVFQPRRGLAAGRNIGIRHSRGEFLVFLDADDRLCPGALSTNCRWLASRPDCAFVYGEHRRIDAAGAITDSWTRQVVSGDQYAALLAWNHIGMHATVMYRRSALNSVGPFDETLEACEDYELMLRIARSHPVVGHDLVIAEYRKHSRAMSTDATRMLRAALRVLRSQRRFVSHDPLRFAAYKTGIRNWRALYGRQALAAARERYTILGEIRLPLLQLLVVLRHAPLELAAMLVGRQRSAPALDHTPIRSSARSARSSSTSTRNPE